MKYNIYETTLANLMSAEEKRKLETVVRLMRYETFGGSLNDTVILLGGSDVAELEYVKYPVCTKTMEVLDLRKFAVQDGKSFRLRSKSNADQYLTMMNELVKVKKGVSQLPKLKLVRFNAELLVARISSVLSLAEDDKESLRFAALANQLVIHYPDTSPSKLNFMFKESLSFNPLADSKIYELLQQEPGLDGLLKAVKTLFVIGDRLDRVSLPIVKHSLTASLPMLNAEVEAGLELLPIQAVLIKYALENPFGKRSAFGMLVTNLRRSKLIDIDGIVSSIPLVKG